MINERVKEFLVSNNLGDRLTEHAETIDNSVCAKGGNR